MPIYRGTQRVTPRPGGRALSRVYRGDRLVWQAGPDLPVVTITATGTYAARTEFRQACIAYGTTYTSVVTLPFRLDTSQSTHLDRMFQYCSSLEYVPDLDTSNVTDARSMFQGCAALTDGNVRLIGKHPSVNTSGMISGSGLTREPFYDTNGNPI